MVGEGLTLSALEFSPVNENVVSLMLQEKEMVLTVLWDSSPLKGSRQTLEDDLFGATTISSEGYLLVKIW